MSTSMAQELIICNLCKSPALRFCNNCQVDLCINCINKHVDELDTLSHEIAPYQKRELQLVFSKCESHPDRRCEAYCQQCQKPVCSKCLIGPHKCHDAEDIVLFVESKKQEIKQKTQELEEKLIPAYKTNEMDLQNQIDTATEEYAKMEEEKEVLRKIWHQEVDDIFEKVSSVIQSMKENDKHTLVSNQTRVKHLILDMIQMVQENKEILKSIKASDVTNYTYKERLDSLCKINPDFDVKIPSLLTKILQGSELCIEIADVKATLTRIPILSLSAEGSYIFIKNVLKKAEVIHTISTKYNPLCRVTCVGQNKAWVSGDKNFIKQVDIRNRESAQVTAISCEFMPLDISLTRKGELIFSDSRTVNIVRQRKIETLITTSQGWKPRGVCCARSGDIIVSVVNANRNKIIRYRERKLTQKINKDEHGIRIFAEGDQMLFVTDNINGDICVSDGNTNKVVVVDKKGLPRFRYDGTPARRKESLDLRCIQTDKHGHIIVADLGNDCLHILDQNGIFLRCVDCELDTPLGLSVDKEGRLWVGLFRSGEIKVIEYLK